MRLLNKASWTPRIHTITTAGTPEHMGGYMQAATISFATNVITDSGSGFLTKGFKTGDNITVSGATNSANNDTFNDVTVAAGTITIDSGITLTTEAASATVTLTAEARSQNENLTQDIDDGVKVNIRAHPDNTGAIYVANSSTNASSSSTNAQPLNANQSINLQIKDLAGVWVDAATSGEKVIISYEI